MGDQPPPRKKSRFFANGKSTIDNLLHPFRKPSEVDDTSQSTPAPARTTDALPPTHHPGGPHFRNAPPGIIYSSNGRQTTFRIRRNQAQPATTGSTTRPQPSRQPSVSESEQETEIESEDESEDQEGEDASDQENTAPTDPSSAVPAIDRLTVRTNRPRAIYGVEDLLPTASSVSGTVAGRASTFGNGQPPTLRSLTESTDVPLLQQSLNAQPASFTFRANQALSAFPQNQNRPQHLGHGLAHMAQQAAHQDTGPLGSAPKPSQGSTSILHSNIGQGYVDTDRDAHGRLLTKKARRAFPSPKGQLRNSRESGTSRLPPTTIPRLYNPPHLSDPDSTVPDNLYSSPGRIEHAKHYAMVSRKRKRPEAILPPPAYVYQRTNNPNFNILDAILLYPELVLAFASVLPVNDLINLYSISRDFHTIIDTRFTTVILSQALSKARDSARSFPFRSFNNLCRDDPAMRIPHPNIKLAERSIPRKIPSFRWLRMILHREKVIHELMTVFAEDGVPLPARCSLALKRLWFVMDVPDNSRRLGVVHNRRCLEDLDLYFIACFFTKLDMRLNDPASGEKRDGLRKLLLTQRGFTPILRVLKREIWTTHYEVMRAWVENKYEPAEDERGKAIFGVPADKIGKGRMEFWGKRDEAELGRRPEVLLRPDQLVVREAFRRGFRFDKHYLRFMLYGYVRPDTLDDYAPRTYGRRIAALKDDEYEVDDLIGGVRALAVGEPGHDPLLDLGTPLQGSIFTIQREATGQDEVKHRENSARMAEMCRQWWMREMAAEMQGAGEES